MTDKHLKFLRFAKKISLKTCDMKRQFGCVIVDRNRIVAFGRNRKSHPKTPTIVSQLTEKKYYGLHAEVHALLKCDFSVQGMTVYVHGQNVKTGNNVYSKPCELCNTILKKRKIESVIFSTPNGYEVIQYVYNNREV
jgi:deoxycytidylate deaminase